MQKTTKKKGVAGREGSPWRASQLNYRDGHATRRMLNGGLAVEMDGWLGG